MKRVRFSLRQLLFWVFVWVALASPFYAHALEAVKVPLDVDAIDLNPAAQRVQGEGDKITLSTAPGADGIVRRIEVRSKDAKQNSQWVIFALSNTTDEQVDRLLVAPHHRLVDSGVIWPDLGANRIEAITASQGVRPERLDAPDADLFLITLDPGTTVTYVAELRSNKLPQLYLWESDAYREKNRSLSLYQGIVIGISSLLALILTVISLIRGKVIFPAAAALAWVALVLVTIQFGFFQKLTGLEGEADHFWRAAAEATLSASLIVFLFAYLNLNRWHVRYSHITAGWLGFIILLTGIAYFDASIAAGIARLSLLLMTFAGFGLILMLATHGFDRAIILIPSWLILTIWVVVAALTVTGRLSNDLISPAVIGGLVLVVLLICFTVLQQAYGSASIMPATMSDVEKKAMALVGSGDFVFDWDVISDKIDVSDEVERALGLADGDLKTSVAGWLEYLHPLDRDRWRSTLDAIQEKGKGRIFMDLRLRATDGHYPWYQLRARPVMSAENQVIRVVGTLSDVTGLRTAEERILHDAVHDNLTGLPNRALFLDRLETALSLSSGDKVTRPTIMFIDIDRFKQVNESVGFAVGDTILLTIARRLSRILKPQDTLGRIGSDHFGIILLSENSSEQIPEIADRFRKAVKSPIMLGDREVVITASIGLTLADVNAQKQKGDALADAELAATHAKRLGGDRIEVFRSTLRSARGDRLALETDLRRATERGELTTLYQPVIRLADKSIAGFEALLRWDHPRLGRLMPSDFIPIAEETGLIGGIGLFALEKAAQDLAQWQKKIDTIPPLFVSVNLSSRQLLRHDLIHDVKVVLVRSGISKGSLRLELTESLVMENPEFSSHMLARLHELGASIALDDFGTGYSSLGYLQRFPIQVLKIDRSIIKSAQKGDQTAVLKSIINLAQDLGMEAIAEGVETEQEVAMLRQLGCNCAQGFYFGQPMPIRNINRLLKIEA